MVQSAGIEFPPRTQSSPPLFTPPQTQPVLSDEDVAIQALLLGDDVSSLRYSLLSRPCSVSVGFCKGEMLFIYVFSLKAWKRFKVPRD